MIDMYPFRNAVTVSHMLLDPYVRQAGVIVDMTCGNGYDTAFLAKLMPADAVLYAFDIQPCAVERTKQRLIEEKLTDRDVRCSVVLMTSYWKRSQTKSMSWYSI